MEIEENRREQLPGSASHGGGKVCRCGWVYSNPHPSKKHRKAHQKHCGAAASKPSHDAADAGGAVDVSEAPCEQLADEDPQEKSAEVVEESKPEGGEGREMGQAGGDGEELRRDARLETDTADNSHQSRALHSDIKVQSSDVVSTAGQPDDSTHLQNHSVSCGVDMVCTTEDTKSSQYSLTQESCLDATKEEMDCATVQNVVDSVAVVNDISRGNHVGDKLDEGIPKELSLPHDFSSNSSLTDSELQKIEKYMEVSVTMDHASAVTMLMSDLPPEVSANTMEPELFKCDSQDVKTDVVEQMSPVQPSCKDGPCSLETNAGELFDIATHSLGREYQIGKPFNSLVNGNEPEHWYTLPVASTTLLAEASEVKDGSLEKCGFNAQDAKTDVVGQMSQDQPSCENGQCPLETSAGDIFDITTHSSGSEYQIDKPANSLVNGNEPENWHTLSVASTTLLVEVSEVKPGSLEDCGLVEPDLSTSSANTEVGNELGRHLADEFRKVVPSGFLAVEFDKNANIIPSALLVNEEFSLHKEKNAIEINESNDDQNCREVNSDRYQLVHEFEGEVVVPVVNFHGPEGKTDQLETHEQFAGVGTLVDQGMDLDGQVTSSCETCSSSIETEEHKFDSLYDGQEAYLSYEGSLTDILRVADSGVAVSGVSQFNATSEINDESQIVSQEATQINSDVVVEEEQHEMGKEESACMDPTIDSQPRCYASELVPPPGDDFEGAELQNIKDVISSKHEEISSGDLDGISDYLLDQPDVQETLEEFGQPVCGDETIDHHDRQAESCAFEAVAENGLPGEHYDTVDLHKDETDNVETKYGSQLELQNFPEDRSADPLSSDENNSDNPFVTKIDVQVPSVEKENNLANMLNEKPKSNVCSEVDLRHDDGENLKTEECSTSKVDVQSFVGKPACDYDSRSSDTAGVASSCFYQPSKGKDVHVESMQWTDSNIGKIDDSLNSDSQTGSVDALWGSLSDGVLRFLMHAAEGESNFDTKASPPTDSLTTKDLHTSDLSVEGVLHKSNVDNNDILEGHSSTTLVEPGRRSISTENKPVQNSKHEGRNINEESAVKLLNSNSTKPHVMLKNLLAEASNLESKQMPTSVRGHIASLTSKRSWGLHDHERSLKTASPKIGSDNPNEPLNNQPDHGEWNSPARLPATKHKKKKVKVRQAWVPFICCPSIR